MLPFQNLDLNYDTCLLISQIHLINSSQIILIGKLQLLNRCFVYKSVEKQRWNEYT